MNIFRIKVADVVVEIESIYNTSQYYCRHFLTSDSPNFKVSISPKDIEYERMMLIPDCNNEYIRDDQLELSSIHRKISNEIVKFDVFLMHAAAITLDGKAYLFTAKSGTGKTTHILKWLKEVRGSNVINGDKPFISMKNEPTVFSSPWSGKEGLFLNVSSSIEAIVFLERNDNNYIEKLSFNKAYPLLYQYVYKPTDANGMKKTLTMIKNMNGKVSFYSFKINNFKNDCVQVAYNALVNGLDSYGTI